MPRVTRYLPDPRLQDLLSALPGRTFVTTPQSSGTDYRPLSAGLVPSLRGARPVSSVKPFFLPSRERVALYWSDSSPVQGDPFSVVGLRACDLLGLAYLDKVFLGGVCEDPFFGARRRAAFLVSVDCAPPQDACFCTWLGFTPFAQQGFDLNLSPIDGGFLVTSGSEAGDRVLAALEHLLPEPTDAQQREAEQARVRMVEALRAPDPSFSQALRRLAGTEVHPSWEPWAGKCVECGACTAVCPTCHCYYLVDGLDPATRVFSRVRTWDSCLFAEYARMAGVGDKLNPRPRLRSRLSNRILHKYVYSPSQYDMLGCLGCGRCDEACMGALSIRQMATSVGGRP